MFAYIVTFFAILFGLTYIYFKKSFNYWKLRNVPCEKPTFPFGNILDIILGKQQIANYFAKLYFEFEGPYFGFYSFTKPFLVIRDPEIIKRVLVKDFQSFSSRTGSGDEKIDPVMGNMLFVIQNPQWKALRMKLSPAFSSGKLKMMMYLMKECCENLKNYMNTVVDRNVELKSLFGMYTTDVITSCIFGIANNSFLDEHNEFNAAAEIVFPHTPLKALKVFAYFFAPFLVKIFRFGFLDATAVKFLANAFLETVAKRETMKTRRNDLVDILIDLKNQETQDDKFKFNDDRLVSQAINFFQAGQETTRSTLAFAVHELCVNPDVQDRLRNEIDEVAQKCDELTYESVQDMKYLHMVVCETIRKYPNVPFLQRECVEDCKLPETGLVVEKGISILIPQYGLQADPKYFPNPEKFDPERFSDENKNDIPPCVYLPFGEGPRNCIAERFGLLAVKLGIIYVIQNFKVDRASLTEKNLSFEPTVFLEPKHGLQVILRKLNV